MAEPDSLDRRLRVPECTGSLLYRPRRDGYRTDPPTGSFWDPATQALLEHSRRPKGRADSRFAKVFRTNWNNGTALYHPYDRVAAQGHPHWAKDQLHLAWTANHTIVDYLEEFHVLLNGGDYVGA